LDVKRDITLMIVADHQSFRDILRDIVGREPRFQVVGEAFDCEMTRRELARLKPQVLMVDLDMPCLEGLKVLRMIREQSIPVKVMALTMHKEKEIVNAAMDLAVSACVLKENAANEIVSALEILSRGETFLSAPMLELGNRWRERARESRQCETQIESLTPVERRVLSLTGEALNGGEIAGRLKMSVEVVEACQQRISGKLGLGGAHGLLKFAFDNCGRMA